MSQRWTSGTGRTPPPSSQLSIHILSWPLEVAVALLKECGVWEAWARRVSCFERVHSWRKLKLEKAALLPAIQPQLAGVCLHKDSSANNLWSVSGGM